jgi:hypothetical protein
MNGIVLQGMRRPTLVTQGYSAHAFGGGKPTIVEIVLAAVRIDGRGGTKIEAAHERCRLALGRP